MDDVIDRLVVSVRADTAGFASDVASLRGSLEGSLGTGADRAGRAIETALLRAVRGGKRGFDDLRATALAVMNQIAAAALRSGLAALTGGGGSGGGLLGSIAQLVAGLPGRATGGAVSPGAAYLVGERGPELFVPTSSGRVETGVGGVRETRIAITVNAPADSAPQALAQSSRQVARAVRAALASAER